MSETEQYGSIEARITAMSAELERLRAELAGLNGEPGSPRSRRHMLKLTGAAIAGAAGAAALRVVPASATVTPVNLDVTNNGTSNTIIAQQTAATHPTFSAFGPGIAAVPSSTQQGINGPLLGVGESGADGVDGYAAGGTGAGVSGQSDAGYGVLGATDTGVDLAAWGTGRLFQRSNLVTGPPAFTATSGGSEIVRDDDSAIWASNADGTWRRVNSVIPIAPVRAIDTRNGTGGKTGPIANGSDLNWQIAGVAAGVPAGAVGVFGNLGVLSATGAGYVALFPADQEFSTSSQPNFASVGWGTGGAGNFFLTGLGTGTKNGLPGSIGAYVNVARSGNCQLIIDIFAYVI